MVQNVTECITCIYKVQVHGYKVRQAVNENTAMIVHEIYI